MRPPARTTDTEPPSSNRNSCDSDSSSPPAILPATASVGLVSPRSTCDSIGADTPERSARSRSEKPIPSRSARMRGPTSITYGCTLSRTEDCSESGPNEGVELLRTGRLRRVLQLEPLRGLRHDLRDVLLGDAECPEPQDMRLRGEVRRACGRKLGLRVLRPQRRCDTGEQIGQAGFQQAQPVWQHNRI